VTTTGEQLAIAGMTLADQAASTDWKDRWNAAIAQLASVGVEFTADDVRELAGEPTDHPNAIGARFHAAARAGLIKRAGYRKSQRTARHANTVAVWVGAA
jgi:hypothetical protein